MFYDFCESNFINIPGLKSPDNINIKVFPLKSSSSGGTLNYDVMQFNYCKKVLVSDIKHINIVFFAMFFAKHKVNKQ
jgi:hypothetical protein